MRGQRKGDYLVTKTIDTVVIGAGQAGLSISYYLTQQGRDHIVLEKSRVGESWRSGRWDSFTLVSPNWTLQLPGFHYQGDAPDGFLTRDEVVDYLERYVEFFNPPLHLGVRATLVKQVRDGGKYLVDTTDGSLEANNVVVATGSFQQPKIPAFSKGLPRQILQIHSGEYRNPGALLPGAVLVVGSGQSGCQVAEELYKTGRKVYLCVGSAGRMPRRYRGRDMAWWFEKTGLADKTVDTLPSPKAKFAPSAHVTGKDGGRTLNLHQFARDGVVLLGRMTGVHGSKAILAPDLMDNLAKADKFAADMKKAVDEYIQKVGLDVPEEPPSTEPEPQDGYHAEVITQLDLKSADIQTVIWATGYTFDFEWIQLPVLDEDGCPVQQRGVTGFRGLYFLGLLWLHTIKSGLLEGVGEDAAHIAADIAARA
jgi:putative flavoprotein involved in K+ transport